MNINEKLPFALKDGIPISVFDVESGLACGCICPTCGRNLQANKGEIRVHYFSHDPLIRGKVNTQDKTQNCEGAFETSIHLMAKQILSEEGYIIFPSLNIQVSQMDMSKKIHYSNEVNVIPESKATFETIAIEKRLGGIRPDIIAYRNEEPYLIEVAVTHFVDEEKKEKIRNLGLPTIEIDLSSTSYKTTKKELTKLLTSASSKRKWISNPEAHKVKNELKTILNKEIFNINKSIYENKNVISSNSKYRLHKKYGGTFEG